MITKEEFVELIASYVDNVKKINEIGDLIGVDNMWDVPCLDYQNQLFEFIIDQLFTNDGVSLISYYIWDISETNYEKLFDLVEHYRK